MIISLAVFGREIFTLEIGQPADVVEYDDAELDEPHGSARVILSGPEFEVADDDTGDWEDHAYEERPVTYGFSPGS